MMRNERTIFTTILLVLTTIMATACGPHGLQKDKIVRNPQASVVIAEGRGHVRVMLYDGHGDWIDYGWVPIEEYRGWTISDYPWPVSPNP